MARCSALQVGGFPLIFLPFPLGRKENKITLFSKWRSALTSLVVMINGSEIQNNCSNKVHWAEWRAMPSSMSLRVMYSVIATFCLRMHSIIGYPESHPNVYGPKRLQTFICSNSKQSLKHTPQDPPNKNKVGLLLKKCNQCRNPIILGCFVFLIGSYFHLKLRSMLY